MARSFRHVVFVAVCDQKKLMMTIMAVVVMTIWKIMNDGGVGVRRLEHPLQDLATATKRMVTIR